jgi:hypothetical protein
MAMAGIIVMTAEAVVIVVETVIAAAVLVIAGPVVVAVETEGPVGAVVVADR